MILNVIFPGTIEKKKRSKRINAVTEPNACPHLPCAVSIIQSNSRYPGPGQVKARLRLFDYMKTKMLFD